MKHSTILGVVSALTGLVMACGDTVDMGGPKDDGGAGSGGTQAGGSGGTAGTAGIAGSGGIGGSGGTGGTGGTIDDAGMTGTRCDNGIGAGGDGCADNFPWDDTFGFKVQPPHLTTGVQSDDTIIVSGASFYTIPQDVLTTLQGATLIALPDGTPIPIQTTWSDDLTWQQHAAQLVIQPTQPLTEGWYAVEIEGNLETGHATPVRIPAVGSGFQSALRVGSRPMLLGAEVCDESVSLRFSELVEIPNPLPITVAGQGNVLNCVRVVDPGAEVSPVTSLQLTCAGLDSWQFTDITIDPGLESTSGVPLRDAEGQETIVLSLPGQSGCRTWQETVIPVD